MSHYLDRRSAGFMVGAEEHPLRFFAASAEVRNQPRAWSSERIHIFDRFDRGAEGRPREIGSYLRNYRDPCAKTFAPFRSDGQWYALYSKHYTATRVMRLPDMQDIGGEDPEARGFCPAELWVPRYRSMTLRRPDGPGLSMLDWHQPHETEGEEEDDQPEADLDVSGWSWSPVGFVAGCHWGDDSSWKIEAFDLRRVAAGVISRFQPLGYLEMGGDSLSQSLDLEMLGADGCGNLRIRSLTWGRMGLPEDPPTSG